MTQAKSDNNSSSVTRKEAKNVHEQLFNECQEIEDEQTISKVVNWMRIINLGLNLQEAEKDSVGPGDEVADDTIAGVVIDARDYIEKN